MSKINQAARALLKNIPKAQADPHRPHYHFLPPANWMNDPNGTIFHDGEYHLFYQFNPARPKWGNLHWGHAKSIDLVDWEHLPIALAPNGFPGELHCWSGCCVIDDDGKPLIFYTSMNLQSLLTRAKRYSQQWMATGSLNLINWEKYPENPVLSEAIHGEPIPEHWRDPYIWKEDGGWLMALCGQYANEQIGRVFLYQSQNLQSWEYAGVLTQGAEDQGRGWECPNYFPLGDRYVLVVSPYGPVVYSVGDFNGHQHRAEAWYTLDHGKDFYATNTYLDDQGRTIIVGWVKAKGDGWAGCLSLPRELKLRNGKQLSMTPIPALEKLRHSHQRFERSLESMTETAGTAPLFGKQIEIKAWFEMEEAESYGFKLLDDNNEYLIAFDPLSRELQVLDETAGLQFGEDGQPVELHIFIDHSVIEIFINSSEAFTAVFRPQLADYHNLKIMPYVTRGKGRFSIDTWKLNDALVSGSVAGG